MAAATCSFTPSGETYRYSEIRSSISAMRAPIAATKSGTLFTKSVTAPAPFTPSAHTAQIITPSTPTVSIPAAALRRTL